MPTQEDKKPARINPYTIRFGTTQEEHDALRARFEAASRQERIRPLKSWILHVLETRADEVLGPPEDDDPTAGTTVP